MITTDLSRNELIKDARIWFGGTPEGIGNKPAENSPPWPEFSEPCK